MPNTRKTAPRKAAAAKKAAPTAKKPSLDALLGEDHRPERVVAICLRGHLQAEWDRLKAQYDTGPGDEDQAMLHDRAAKRRVAERMAEVEADMRAGTVEFRLRALPRRRTPGMAKDAAVWGELVEKHPPRKTPDGKVDPRDAGIGVNAPALFEDLVRASIVEPELSGEQWAALDAKLSDAQFQQLAWAAWQLNRSEVDVPFSRAASMMRRLDAGSRRRNDSASASSGGTGGSRSTSPSTSTTTTDG